MSLFKKTCQICGIKRRGRGCSVCKRYTCPDCMFQQAKIGLTYKCAFCLDGNEKTPKRKDLVEFEQRKSDILRKQVSNEGHIKISAPQVIYRDRPSPPNERMRADASNHILSKRSLSNRYIRGSKGDWRLK